MEQAELDEKIKRVEERHQHSRGLATALSATIIGLSGGLFYMLNAAPDAPVLLLLSLDGWARLLLGLSIVFAVLLQFFHVLGYLHHARALNKQVRVEVGPELERKNTFRDLKAELDKSTISFVYMDLAVKAAVFAHLAGLVAVGIGHIW